MIEVNQQHTHNTTSDYRYVLSTNVNVLRYDRLNIFDVVIICISIFYVCNIIDSNIA